MKDAVRTSRAGNSRAGNSRAGNSRASNWRCPYGELDVVAAQDGEIVYVEATTRRGTELGAPEAAIAAGKWAHVITSAHAYLAAERLENRHYRSDVLAVDLAPLGGFRGVRHFPHGVGE